MNRLRGTIIVSVFGIAAFAFYGLFLVDDGYITLRYALNAVEGHGLRFNPVDAAPVEGYTNFGWLCCQIPFLFFTRNEYLIFGFLSLCTIGGTLFLLNSSQKIESWSLSPAIIILASFHSFWFWNMSGMETGFLGLIILWWNMAFLSLVTGQGRLRSCIAPGVLAMLTRPDAAIVLCCHWLILLRAESIKNAFRYVAVIVAVLLPYGLWKLLYFGSVLPNTFHAKTGFSRAVFFRGLYYVGGFFFFPELVFLMVLFLMLIYYKKKDSVSFVLSFLLVGSYLLYFLLVGGDYFPFYRFLYPLIPWLVYSGSTIFPVLSVRGQYLLVGACVLSFLLTTATDPFVYSLSFGTDNRYSVVAARRLATLYPPGTTAVTAASGVVNYYCNFTSTDLYGLTDPSIAKGEAHGQGRSMAGHDKYDIEYVESIKPSLIIPHLWVPGSRCTIDFRSSSKWLLSDSHTSDALRALLNADFLKEDYVQKTLSLTSDGQDFVYVFYERTVPWSSPVKTN